MNDKERFKKCCEDYKNRETKNGIGTYKEKTLHRIIKNYYNDNPLFQEVRIAGYVCDICCDGNIIEIQTRNFSKLAPKLNVLCNEYNVKVIYPIVYNKYLSWLDCTTGEITKRRKSPKVGTIYDAFYELYRIKLELNNPNLKIVLLLVNCDEIRNLNGWSENKKKGSSRENQIPFELVDEITIDDYKIFIPQKLEIEFTSKEYAMAINKSLTIARIGLTILQYCNVIKVVGKVGRNNLYRIKKD